MHNLTRVVLALCAVAAGGCGTVSRARLAQERVSAVGAGVRTAPSAYPDLRAAGLRELVSHALAHRPSVVSAELAVKDARLALKEICADAPLASATPWSAATLGVSGAYAESAVPASFSDLRGTVRGKATGSLSLDLLVWDFGRNAARQRAQAENVVASELALTRAGYAVFEEVSRAYFAWRQADALLAVAETNQMAAAEHLRDALDRKTAGVAVELDVLRARLDAASAAEALVAASNDVTTAGAELMTSLGVGEGASAAEVLGRRTDLLARPERAFAETADDARAVYAFALTNAPSLAVSRARLRAASAAVDYAVADLRPNLRASASLSWTDPLWVWGWGVSAAESLFTGFRRTTAVERAVVAMDAAAEEVRAEELALSESVEKAVAERDNARAALAAAEKSLATAEENFMTVASRYREGESSRVDFTDALAARTQARGSCVRAFCRTQTAEAALFARTGRMPAYAGEQTNGGSGE